jgi:DNA-directed RNA polymerase subunit K/omega
MADEDGGMDAVADIEEELEEQEEEEEQDEEGGKREVAKESRALKFLLTHHPECRVDYRQDVLAKLPLAAYPPDNGRDPNHKTVPFLTLYEKTKVIGFRANQLAKGARPLINKADYPHVIDVLEIARIELEQRRLPFILKRPLPDGTYEYWKLNDLMIL